MTNHKWNILNIMRFYNRIGKQFNAQVYVCFVTPHDGPNKGRNVPTLSKVYEYIRRFISNGWCVRDGEENVLITPKGLKALEAWEKTRYVQQAQVSDETLRRRRLEQE